MTLTTISGVVNPTAALVGGRLSIEGKLSHLTPLYGSRWPSGNTLDCRANGSGSTPGRGTLELDTGYNPSLVGEMCSN